MRSQLPETNKLFHNFLSRAQRIVFADGSNVFQTRFMNVLSSSNRFVNLYAFLIIALFFASRFSLLGIGQFSYTKITNKSNTLIDATPDALSLYVFPFRRLLVRCHMREKNWNVNQPISSRRHWPWSTPRVQRLTIADSRRRTDKSRLQIDRPWSGNMANCQ